MESNEKYPVKYAVMGITEPTGWRASLNELELEYNTVAYIVSKVYLVEEKIKYKRDGQKAKEYICVFPYKEIGQRIYPQFNMYGECYNAEVLENVFETFEEAKSTANRKNLYLRSKICRGFSILDKNWIAKLKEEQDNFDKNMKKHLEFEQEILNLSKDMEIRKNSSDGFIPTDLETILNNILDNPELFYEKICENLTFEERQFIDNLIENKSCNTCSNGCCRVENYEKPVDNCIGWENNRLVGKYKVLKQKRL